MRCGDERVTIGWYMRYLWHRVTQCPEAAGASQPIGDSRFFYVDACQRVRFHRGRHKGGHELFWERQGQEWER